MFWILVLYLDFKGAKNIHVLQVLMRGFGWHWRFLTGVLHFDLNLYMVTGPWYSHTLNFGSLCWFWRWKGPDLGLWRLLKVPDWGLASWLWFRYAHWSLIQQWFEFQLSILIFKVQRTSMSFKSWFGALENTEGLLMGFCILIMIWIWSLVFVSTIFRILALFLDFEGGKNIHALQYAEGSWLGFGILILIWTWSLIFGKLQFRILVLYLNF